MRTHGMAVLVLATITLLPGLAAAQPAPDEALRAVLEQVERDGAKAGPAVMKELAKRTDPMERLGLLDILARIRHEPALPEMAKLLEEPGDQLRWQRMLVFGKMGKLAIPMLTAQLESPNRTVRLNSADMLGNWLVAPEAVEPLRKLFWRDPDVEVKVAVLRQGLRPEGNDGQVGPADEGPGRYQAIPEDGDGAGG